MPRPMAATHKHGFRQAVQTRLQPLPVVVRLRIGRNSGRESQADIRRGHDSIFEVLLSTRIGSCLLSRTVANGEGTGPLVRLNASGSAAIHHDEYSPEDT